jgi:hypothetical protein
MAVLMARHAAHFAGKARDGAVLRIAAFRACFRNA